MCSSIKYSPAAGCAFPEMMMSGHTVQLILDMNELKISVKKWRNIGQPRVVFHGIEDTEYKIVVSHNIADCEWSALSYQHIY